MKITKKATKCFKKMIAAVAAAMLCMALWTGTFTANAADASTIDKDAKGSITVTKYGTTNEDHAGSDGAATGNTSDDDGIDKSSYTTIEGVKFNLYKIADAEEVLEYYNGKNTVEYTIEMKKDENLYLTGETDENGVCKFDKLPVGIYVLEEAVEGQPSQVTAGKLAETTLISVPMVNTATSRNDSGKWMYDVNVYPKNTIKPAGTLVITKQDQDGTSLSGVQFELKKKDFNNTNGFDDDAVWESVVAKNEDGTDKPYTTDEEGKLTIDSLTAGEFGTQYMLVETSAPDGYIVNKTPMYFKVTATNTMTWNRDDDNNKLTNENSGVISHDEKNTKANNVELDVTIKNEIPSLKKTVEANAGKSDWSQDAAYQISDNIRYRLVVKVPENVDELGEFSISDAPDNGITDTTTGISVKYSDSDSAFSNALSETDYKVDADEDGGFTFTLTDAGETKVKAKYIEIIYNAYLNESAVIADKGNKNDATLTYSKYINNNEDTATSYTIKDETRVYTYQAKITKYLEVAEKGNEAEGVEFKLLDAAGKEIGVAKEGAGVYRIALSGEDKVDTMVTAADGTILIKGLRNTDYKLKETKTLDNYNLLSKPYDFTVGVNEKTTWNNGDDYSVVHVWGGTAYSNGGGDQLKDATVSETIINRKGFVLPKTGSMGFILFCFVGLALIAGGAMLIFGGRRKKIK